MGEFRMPSLGADMEAGTLVEWTKQPGDTVARGDIIAVVETAKGAIEVESFESGTLERLLVDPGATVPVGTPLAIIAGAGEKTSAPPPASRPSTAEFRPEIPPAATAARASGAPTEGLAPSSAPPQRPGAEPGRRRISPAARRLAAERGIDPAALRGTGPAGAVISADVLGAPEAPRAAASSGGLDLGAMRRAIAAAMARSKREIPHYYLSHTVDLTPATSWLSAVNAERSAPARLLLGALLLKAAARAAHEVPEMNGFMDPEGFRPAQAVHAGMAINIRGGGLVAPAVHDTDTRTLDQIMEALRDLVTRARAGSLRSSELSDPTITVSSLGERGVDTLYGVIYPPQVAIVGFGTPAQRPWVVDGNIEPRTVLTVTLAADHRASDGHRGARFLAVIDRLLQEPEVL